MFSEPTPQFARVDVGRIGHAAPAWSFEMPVDWSLRMLARVLAVATGVESEWLELDTSHTRIAGLGRRVWTPEDPTFHRIGIDGDHWVSVAETRPAHVGDSMVRLLACDAEPPRARIAWWDGLTPIDVAQLQRELDCEFGFVPRVVEPWECRTGVDAGSPLDNLLAALPSSERLALGARLEQRGILRPEPLKPHELARLTTSLAVLGDVVGDGWDQGTDGRLPAEFVSEAGRALDWPTAADGSAPVTRLIEVAWDQRLLRRLRGRVLRTHRGRLAERGIQRAVAVGIVHGTNAARWRHPQVSPAGALALLAVADGVGTSLAEVPRLLAGPLGALLEPDDKGWGAPAAQDTGAASIPDRLALLSPPGEYGTITPEMRRLAHVVVLEGDDYASPF